MTTYEKITEVLANWIGGTLRVIAKTIIVVIVLRAMDVI